MINKLLITDSPHTAFLECIYKTSVHKAYDVEGSYMGRHIEIYNDFTRALYMYNPDSIFRMSVASPEDQFDVLWQYGCSCDDQLGLNT